MKIKPLKQDQKSALESPRPIFLITGCIIELAPGENLPEFPEGKGGFVAMAMSGCLVRTEQPQEPAIEPELEEMRLRAERAEDFECRERALRREIQAENNSLVERNFKLAAHVDDWRARALVAEVLLEERNEDDSSILRRWLREHDLGLCRESITQVIKERDSLRLQNALLTARVKS